MSSWINIIIILPSFFGVFLSGRERRQFTGHLLRVLDLRQFLFIDTGLEHVLLGLDMLDHGLSRVLLLKLLLLDTGMLETMHLFTQILIHW